MSDDYHRAYIPTASSPFRPVLAALSWPVGAALARLRRPLPDAPDAPRVLAPRSTPGHSTPGIPKIIWTYWHAEPRPPIVDLCFANWRSCCPD